MSYAVPIPGLAGVLDAPAEPPKVTPPRLRSVSAQPAQLPRPRSPRPSDTIATPTVATAQVSGPQPQAPQEATAERRYPHRVRFGHGGMVYTLDLLTGEREQRPRRPDDPPDELPRVIDSTTTQPPRRSLDLGFVVLDFDAERGFRHRLDPKYVVTSEGMIVRRPAAAPRRADIPRRQGLGRRRSGGF